MAVRCGGSVTIINHTIQAPLTILHTTLTMKNISKLTHKKYHCGNARESEKEGGCKVSSSADITFHVTIHVAYVSGRPGTPSLFVRLVQKLIHAETNVSNDIKSRICRRTFQKSQMGSDAEW